MKKIHILARIWLDLLPRLKTTSVLYEHIPRLLYFTTMLMQAQTRGFDAVQLRKNKNLVACITTSTCIALFCTYKDALLSFLRIRSFKPGIA